MHTNLIRTLQVIKRPYAVFLVGAPGSGKSTWLRENYDSIQTPFIVGTDKLLEQVASSTGVTYSEAWFAIKMKDIEDQMWAELEAAVAVAKHIVVDRTNMSVKSRSRVLSRIPAHYARFAAVFTVERSELDRRLEERNKTGKVISQEILEGMLNRYEEPTTHEFEAVFV